MQVFDVKTVYNRLTGKELPNKERVFARHICDVTGSSINPDFDDYYSFTVNLEDQDPCYGQSDR